MPSNIFEAYSENDYSFCYQVGENDGKDNKARNPNQPSLKQEAFYAFEDIGQQGDWKTFEQEFMAGCTKEYNRAYDLQLQYDREDRIYSSPINSEDSREYVYQLGSGEGYANKDCKQDGINDALQSKPKTRVSPADLEFRALVSFDQIKQFKSSTLKEVGLYEAFLEGFEDACNKSYSTGYDSVKNKNPEGNVLEDAIGQIKGSVEEKVSGVIKENSEHLAQEIGESIADQVVPDVSSDDCVIATASFGSPLAKEVQMLREIRDNHLLKTESGSSFMKSFNAFYYSFAPTIAQWERDSPAFKEVVRTTITPLITSLSLLQHVNMDSEVEVLSYGISMIALNVGMYFVAPAVVVWQIKKRI